MTRPTDNYVDDGGQLPEPAGERDPAASVERLQLRIDNARDILRWGMADPHKAVIAAHNALAAMPP